MNILILGGGGREHALAWAFAQNPRCDRLWCAPGNAGIAEEATCVALDILDGDKVLAFARENDIGFVMIGPEAPLAEGVADVLRAGGMPTFGPSRAAARLEASKAFTKEICAACGAPTAAGQTFTDAEAARAYVDARGAPIVVKADGLAAGKGVTVAETVAEAQAALEAIFREGAGARAVVEDFMAGEEASLFVLADGEAFCVLGTAQDHKRAFDGDLGPNTGGMGACSPAPVLTPEITATAIEQIVRPTLAEMARRGTPFQGVLYAGLMIADGSAAARRIQRPLRRPRGAGAGDAPRRAAPRRLLRRGDGRACRRARGLRRRPRPDRGDGGARLSRRLPPRRADRADRKPGPARQGLPRRHPARGRRCSSRTAAASSTPPPAPRASPRPAPSPTPRCSPSTGPAGSTAPTSAGARSTESSLKPRPRTPGAALPRLHFCRGKLATQFRSGFGRLRLSGLWTLWATRCVSTTRSARLRGRLEFGAAVPEQPSRVGP